MQRSTSALERLASFSEHPSNTATKTAEMEPLCRDIIYELYSFVCNEFGSAVIGDVILCLKKEGIWFWRDERLKGSQEVALRMVGYSLAEKTNPEAQRKASNVSLGVEEFNEFASPCASLFLKAFSEEFVIPDWNSFVTDMTFHFQHVASFSQGKNADYIPILRDANPDVWGLSMCSIDGQRFSIGDSNVKHTLQSVSKPVTYALGMTNEGHEFMDQWIGVEPAGRPFNTQDLEPDTQRPFNASVNSGAIMAAAIYASAFPKSDWNEVVDKVRDTWFELCGNDLPVGFSEETFESEKSSAFNNFAIAYNLKGRKGLPRDIDLHKMVEVYLGCCSIETSTEALSVAAATLANGGVCPITRRVCFPADVVRTVLAETMTCGMYNQAGHFAVEVGLPAKSGVSGALMVIVPNVFGFATFSPRLNEKGNSVRGIEFCKRLVSSYRVHMFEPKRSGNTGAKIDPCRNGWKEERKKISRMAWAVKVGDSYATRLRDIFLFALCQAANASGGMTDKVKELICKSYHDIYQAPVDDELFEEVQAAANEHPGELRYISELTKNIHIVDSMRSLIIMAVLDVIMVEGKASERAQNVAVRIGSLLGVDESVITLELNRFKKHAGSHFKTADECNVIGKLDNSAAENIDSPRFTHKKSIFDSRSKLFPTNLSTVVDIEEEAENLRQENQRLRQRVSALSALLASPPPNLNGE